MVGRGNNMRHAAGLAMRGLVLSNRPALLRYPGSGRVWNHPLPKQTGHAICHLYCPIHKHLPFAFCHAFLSSFGIVHKPVKPKFLIKDTVYQAFGGF